jgi:predicted transcriptional regulator
MKKYKKDTLLEATPNKVQKEIDLIYSIKEISEDPSENQSLNNIANHTAYGNSTAIDRIKEDLKDKNLVEIQPSDNEGHGKKVELTSKGEELYNALKPLDYNIKTIEEGVNRLRKKIRRNPTKDEITEKLGLKLDIETLSKVDGWREPSETVQKEARKELQEILEYCLIPIHYDLDVEKMQKAEEKELNQAAEYYLENKEVMDDFKQISDSREYRCPVELENFVESRKMKAPPRPISLN